MITLGADYFGSELFSSPVRQVVSKVTNLVADERGPWESGDVPSLNAVFVVSGSLGGTEQEGIQATRFSRKNKMVLVAIPMDGKLRDKRAVAEIVMSALRTAAALAHDAYARRRAGDFDLARALEILDRVEIRLAQWLESTTSE